MFSLKILFLRNVTADIQKYTHRKRETFIEAQKRRESDKDAAASGSKRNGNNFEAFLRKQRFKTYLCSVEKSVL